MHQYKITVLDFRLKQADLRLDVRAWIVVCDNKLAIGCACLLREGVIAPKCEDKKIAVQTADKRAVVIRHDDVSRTLRENMVQFFVLFRWEVDGI